MVSESVLSRRIAERIKDWCPNSHRPNYSRDAWAEIFAAEDALAAKQIAAEAKSLGLDSLRREVAALRQEVATLRATQAKIARKLVKDVEAHNSNWRKQVDAEEQIFARIAKLEARPVEAVDLDFDLVDGRTLQIKNGAATKSFALPVPVDKGIYKQGTAYSAGDCVSCQGSYWICKEFTSAAPGKSNYWRLVAKRGRDGRDAKS